MKKTTKSRSDTAVQGTNDSSIVSKVSTCMNGYFKDEFVHNFVAKCARRAPLINRGYYIRYKAVDHALQTFLRHVPGKKQIVSLGAGFDSSFFRLKAENALEDTTYFEVDFPGVMMRKKALIDDREQLRDLIRDDHKKLAGAGDYIILNTSDYKMVAVDLTQRDLLNRTLTLCDLDPQLPTLLLSEVVITYMENKHSDSVIEWASITFPNSIFVTYEQVYPDDPFGIVMMNHFTKLGSTLRSIRAYPTPQSQVIRYANYGYEGCLAADLNYIYNNIASSTERSHVRNLEPFDEEEEWNIKCKHYILLTALKGSCVELCDKLWIPNSKCCEIFANSETKYKLCSKSVQNDGDAKSDVYELFHNGALFMKFSSKCGDTSFSKLITENSKNDNSDENVTNIQEQEVYFKKATYTPLTNHNAYSACLKRFSHASTLINGNVCVLTGGFGEVINKNHGRIKEISAVRLNGHQPYIYNQVSVRQQSNASLDSQAEISVSKESVNTRQSGLKDTANSSTFAIERLHHTATHISNSRIFIFGGRTSPTRPCEDSVVLKFRIIGNHVNSGDETNESSACAVKSENNRENGILVESCTAVQLSGDVPGPRWRHFAVCFNPSEGGEYIFIYGGRSRDPEPLDDCYVIDTDTWISRKITLQGEKLPGKLQSHSIATWKDKFILSGGQNEELFPVNDIWVIETSSFQSRLLQVQGHIYPRYSHKSHVHGNCLILVGGVSTQHCPAEISTVDLITGVCHHIQISGHDPELPIFLHGNTMELLYQPGSPADEQGSITFIILGGGGNCFSFGTHLNNRPVILELTR